MMSVCFCFFFLGVFHDHESGASMIFVKKKLNQETNNPGKMMRAESSFQMSDSSEDNSTEMEQEKDG